jgi:cytosol alanyl aminopeptidase
LLGTLALAGCRSAEKQASALPKDEVVAPAPGRLPRAVAPVSYDLTLTIDPEAERFSGETVISLEVAEATSKIFLHAENLTVESATIKVEASEPKPAFFRQVGDEGLAEVILPVVVGPGRATLAIRYDAPFDPHLEGLFKVTHGGASYAFTQFEPFAARRAFPCFDEPGWKTPFDLSLIVRQEHAAIANSLRQSEERQDDGKKRVRFARTAKLPTYLVAFAVGPLDVVQGPDLRASAVRERPIPLRAASTAGRGDQLSYALANTQPIVLALEAYFGSPYPFDKLDIIAIPDFSAGAMENAGAITFKDSLLLVDEATSPADQKRNFAYYMAHELAHQWVGNLVTMPWWDDLWLNEAFATFMETHAVLAVRPDYNPRLAAVEFVHSGMREDALVSARRIREPIVTPHDVMNAFDSITYAKGSGVLAMFERYLGAERFRQALGHYLRKHAHGTAGVDDFLGSMSEALGADIATPFMTFLSQSGVPLVEVTPRCASGTGELLLRQSRYLPLGSSGDAKRAWQIPVCARYGIGNAVNEICALLTEPSAVVALPAKGCPSWVMPNAEGAGYYRWTLPPRDLATLLTKGKLSDAELLSAADGLFAQVASGRVPAADAYAQLPMFTRSEQRSIVVPAFELISQARQYLVPPELLPKLEQFAQKLAAPIVKRVGTTLLPDPKASEDKLLLRRDVLVFLSDVARDKKVRAELAAAGRAFVGVGGDGRLHPEVLDSNFVSTALAVAVQESDAAIFDALVAHLRVSDNAVLRRDILLALGSAKTAPLAERARKLALDPDVRAMEVKLVAHAQATQPETRHELWRFITEHIAELQKRLPTDDVGALPYVAAGMCSGEDADRVQAFLLPKVEELLGGPRNLAAAVESIRLCAALVEKQGESARAFFGK